MSAKSSIVRSLEMYYEDKFEAIQFVAGSASLNEKDSSSSQGIIKKQTLTFKITPVSIKNDRIISKIRRCVVFKIVDAQSYASSIGCKAFPPKILIDKITSGSAGGFVGYSITIEATSL